MNIEQVSNAAKSEEDGAEEEIPERRIATGPFAPDPEDQLRDAQAFLADFETPRDENAEVNVSEEYREVSGKLEEVEKLIAKEKEKEDALGSVRAELRIPHETGDAVKKLEATREQLLEDKRHLEFAEKHEPVFDELADLSESEREHVAKTGKTKDGRFFHDKDGNRVREDVAKELAHSYLSGGGRLTWGSLRKLGKVADEIVHDVTSAVTGTIKSMFTGSQSAEKRGE